MRSAATLALLAGVTTAALAQANLPTRRLAFEATGADTATCNGVRLQFQDFRTDMHGGIGFAVRLTNTGSQNVEFDPLKIRAELPNGRRIAFLSATEIASQFMQTEASRVLDSERREMERRDIEGDPRFAPGPVRPWIPTQKYLALGWSRVTGGEPTSYLPVTLYCDRQAMGRINFAGTGGN
jgi:hypothetical protein